MKKRFVSHFMLGVALACFTSAASARADDVMLIRKDGSKLSGFRLSESDRQMTLSIRETDRVRQVVVDKADIVEFTDHRAVRDILMTKATKARVEKDIATAEEEVRRAEKDFPKAMKALYDFRLQRQSNSESAKQKKELDQQEYNLQVDIKGSQIPVAIAQAKVSALRSELEQLNRRIAELEKRSWKAR